MTRSLKKISVKLDADMHDRIEQIAIKENESVSQVVRNLIDIGLNERVLEENTELIAKVVRQQMDIVIKPHIERLAALSSKTGHMAGTATFLNVQAFLDLVPNEKRKDVMAMYEKARKKSAVYMKTPTSDKSVIDDFKEKK